MIKSLLIAALRRLTADTAVPRIEIGDSVLVAIPVEDWKFLISYDPANARDREPSKKDLIRVLQDLRDDLEEWRLPV